MYCIIGSGPSAAACAAALLKRGCAVRMLDAGIRLEEERAKLVRRLAQSAPENWNPQEVERLKEGMEPGMSGIPEKRIFGSDYPYREADDHLGIASVGVGLRASFAVGGLSTVWGAAMLPCVDRDIADWPITAVQLASHYASVSELTGLSAERDGLDELFPLFIPTPGQLQPSRQATAMLHALERHREKLRTAGIHHGRARVAIKATRGHEPGCVYCGLCMYGCPYGYIYRSDDTIAQFERSNRFKYQRDVVITAVREMADQVAVTGYHRVTREPLEWKAERVYLAAGAIPTTGILLRSLSAFDQPVQMKDSQYFLLPLLLTKHIANVRQERLHSLSQVFLEILDDRISPHTVHLQVYSFNDLIGKAVRKTMGALARPLDFFARELEGRLLLIQGFIHSTHSSQIEVVLRKDPANGRETLRLQAELNPATKQIIRRVVRKLLRHSRKLGAIPLPMLLQVAEPGRSFHTGGSFPMRANPTRFETDLLGRPAGWKRVHAVDATVLPSIPATTITFTVMANAHRIGWESATLS